MIAGIEWIVVAAVVVLIFFGGGKKIAEFARSIGRASGEFKKGREEVEAELESTRRARKPATAKSGKSRRK